MEDFVESITRGNVAEVKAVLATVVIALAVYQLALIAVAYGRLRPAFLAARPAGSAHRWVGDAIVALVVVVGGMCFAVYGFDEDGGLHATLGVVLLGVFAVKIGIVRFGGHGIGRLLPLLGGAVFVLLAVTWATSTGDVLGDR